LAALDEEIDEDPGVQEGFDGRIDDGPAEHRQQRTQANSRSIPGFDCRRWFCRFSSSIKASALRCARRVSSSLNVPLSASMTGDGVKSPLPGGAFGHTTMVTGPFRSRIRAVSRASDEIWSYVGHIS
jgi:hypothetical protein